MTDLLRAADRFVRAVYHPAIEAAHDAGRGIAGALDDLVRTERTSADETAREVATAWHEQPTIERRLAVGASELVENGIQRDLRRVGGIAAVGAATAAGAAHVALEMNPIVLQARATAHVAAAGARGGVAAVEELAGGASRIASRTAGTHAENARHVGDALSEVARTEARSLQRTGDAVRAAWADQPTIERKLAVSGWRLLEGGVRQRIDRHVAGANVVRELGGAAVRDATTGLQNVGDAIATNWRATGAFLGGLFGG